MAPVLCLPVIGGSGAMAILHFLRRQSSSLAFSRVNAFHALQPPGWPHPIARLLVTQTRQKRAVDFQIHVDHALRQGMLQVKNLFRTDGRSAQPKPPQVDQ